MAVGGALHMWQIIVHVTTNIAFMNDKEVEYLINSYQSERSLWDSNDECYYDANKRLQGVTIIIVTCRRD